MPTAPVGRVLIILGAVFILAGLALTLAGKVPLLGRLPGDFSVKRGNFTFYFPLATSIIISVVLSFLLYLVSRVLR